MKDLFEGRLVEELEKLVKCPLLIEVERIIVERDNIILSLEDDYSGTIRVMYKYIEPIRNKKKLSIIDRLVEKRNRYSSFIGPIVYRFRELDYEITRISYDTGDNKKSLSFSYRKEV